MDGTIIAPGTLTGAPAVLLREERFGEYQNGTLAELAVVSLPYKGGLCDRTDAPIGFITDIGQFYRLRSIATGIRFKIAGFSVGCHGYDPDAPLTVLPADTSLTELRNQVFPPIVAPDDPIPIEAIDRLEPLPSSGAQAFHMRLDPNEAVTGIGEVALWAEIVDDNGSVDPLDAEGTRFLFAVLQTPMQAKTPHTAMIFRAIFV